MKTVICLIMLLSLADAFAECPTASPCIEVLGTHEEKFTRRAATDPQEDLDLVTYAKGFIGTPYQYGGNNENGIDCSAFVQKVFQEFGINLPRTSRDQFNDQRALNIDQDQVEEHDLLFFKDDGGTEIDHVAIYIGNGKMIHSSRSENGVQISDFKFSPFWSKRFYAAKRLTF
jgi:cell wall-associated NlpC family hydrolase